MATRDDIPFSIEDVARAMGIQIKRVVRDQLYCRCPFCDDHSAHLNINLSKDIFRCPRCGAQGGILDLYAMFHQISKNAAYNELCELIKSKPKDTSMYGQGRLMVTKDSVEVPLAPSAVRNNTYSNLLALLNLGSVHKESLMQRGLVEQQILWTGYRTTPAVRSQRIVTALLDCGCKLEGVPGFFINKETGRWELDIRGSGIMIPDRNIQGEIEAIQIRRDYVKHSKYNNLTSTGQYMGASALCCPHYVGFEAGMETVYITEGVLKADVAYCLSKGLGKHIAFIGLTGVANKNQYIRALDKIGASGVQRIVLAFDSDCKSNPAVASALNWAEQIGISKSFDIIPIYWDLHFKGIDDLLLSFKKY